MSNTRLQIHAPSTDPALHFPVAVGRSPIDGMGAFAAASIPARRKIGEITGTIVRLRRSKPAPASGRIYLVEFPDGRALDASEHGNALRHVNHGCSPNCYIRVIGTHVEVYALRRIRKGEELTANYGETHHAGTLPCRCGSPQCKGWL